MLPILSLLMFITAQAQMTDTLRKRIVDEHNRIKRTITNGANMIMYEYDLKLECVAQAYIETQTSGFTHNPNRGSDYTACGGTGGAGENWFSGGPNDATYYWCDYPWSGCSERDAYAGTCSGVKGHFTQVAWATSYKVGCGYTSSGGTVCNYNPPGNYPTAPWVSGTPCSKCPTGFPFCDNGLCTAIDPQVRTCATYLCPNNTRKVNWADTCASNVSCVPDECCGPVGFASLLLSPAPQSLGGSGISAVVLVPLFLIGLAVAAFFLRAKIHDVASRAAASFPEENFIIFHLILTLLQFGSALAALSEGHWAYGSGVALGLWQLCYSYGDQNVCTDATKASVNTGLFNAIRSFVVIAVVCSLVAIVCYLLVIFHKFTEHKHSLYLASVALLLSCVALSFLAGTLFGAIYDDDLSYLDRGAGFILIWVCWVLSAVVAFSGYCLVTLGGGGGKSGSSSSKAASAASSSQVSSSAAPTPVPSAPASPGFSKAKPPPAKDASTWGDWVKNFDDNQKTHYYYNSKTGESRWEPPVGWPHK